jgi:hypothetical protein
LNPILILAKIAKAFDLDALESDLELADKLVLENLQILESMTVVCSLGFLLHRVNMPFIKHKPITKTLLDLSEIYCLFGIM